MNKDLEILKRFLDRQKNDISKQGYKDDSPYRNNPSNTIYGTPQGTPITMKGVSTPLIGMDEFGNKQHMMPGQEYQFPGSQVTEMPIAQVGKNITESTSVYKKPFNDKELKNILKDNKELVRTGDIKNPRAEANKFEKYLPTKETANFFKKLKKDVGPELFKEALKIQHERGNPAVNVGTNKGLPFHNKRNYNPFTNEVNIPKPLDDTSDLKNYLKEVAHAGQPLSEVIPRFLKNDIPGYIKAYTTEGDSGDNIEQYVYDNPNTVENYTHHIIQPKLEERVYSSFKIPMSEAEEAEDVELYRQYFNKPMYQMGGTGMMYADRNYAEGGEIDPPLTGNNPKRYNELIIDTSNKQAMDALNKKFGQLHNKSKMSCTAGSLNCLTDFVQPILNSGSVRTLTQQNTSKYKIPSKPYSWLKGEYVPNNSIDAWEIHNQLSGEGLGTNLINPKSKLTYKKDKKGNNISQIPDQLDYKNLPVGTILGQGDSANAYTDPKYGTRSRHAMTIIGYDKKDGEPLVYDFGEIRRLSDNTGILRSAPINNVTIPKGYENYTMGNLVREYNNYSTKLGYGTHVPVNYNSKKEHILAIQNSVNDVKDQIGFDYNIPQTVINKMALMLPGLANQETGINNNEKTTYSAIADNIVGNYIGKPGFKIAKNTVKFIGNAFKEEGSRKKGYELEIEAYKKYPNDLVKRKAYQNQLINENSNLKNTNYEELTSSVGPFSIKNIPAYSENKLKIKKGDMFGVDFSNKSELENGSKVALNVLAENYANAKKQNPNLDPDELIDLSLASYNSGSKLKDKRYVKYFINKDTRKLNDAYLEKIKKFKLQNGGDVDLDAEGWSRQTTPHYQEGGLKKKKIIIPDERYEGFVKKDNVPNFKINIGRPLSQQQVEQKRLQALKDKQGTFSTAEPAESTLTHALNIATLPLTALKYKMQKGYVPDNLVRYVINNPGELNPYDLAYLATIARAVPGAGMAAQPLVQPLVSAGASALGANAFGVAGLNAANAIGAGFATHGAMNIGPDTSAWIDKPSWEKAGTIGWDVLDMAPAISASAKTIGEGFNLASNAAKSSANAKVIPGIKPRSLPEKLVPVIEHDPTKHTHTTIRFKDPKNPHGDDYGYLGLENKTEWLKDANGEYIRDAKGMPQKSTVEWLRPSMISVNPKLQGNRLQDVLYQLGIDEAYKQKLSGIISGETLLSPQKTSKAHERFNRVVFDSKLSFPVGHFSTRGVAVPHDIVGLTGHKNPNVVSDWMNNYKTINKHFPRRYHSLKDMANAPLNWAKNNKQDAFLAGAGSATLGSIGYLMDKVINNEDLYGRSSKEVSDEFNEEMRILNLRDEIDSLENNYKSVKNIDTKQVGGEKTVKYGTPEYEAAYNRGEVITEDGQRSPIALDEVVVQNNYKRPRGFWEQYRDKILDENKDSELLGAIIGTPISAITSLPQLAMMKGITGKMQRPSEAWGFNNQERAFKSPTSFGKHAFNFVLDAVTDPFNLVVAGALSPGRNLSKFNIKNAESFTNSFANPVSDLKTLGQSYINRNKPLYTIGANNLEQELIKKIKQLESPEGFKRLAQQEAHFIKSKFPNLSESEILKKANNNAQTRISELYQTTLKGNVNKNYIDARKLNSELLPRDFDIPMDNASFTRGNIKSEIIDLQKHKYTTDPFDNSIDVRSLEQPGEIRIGSHYAENLPVYDHEINHALQNGDVTAIDEFLANHFKNPENVKVGLTPKKKGTTLEKDYRYLLKGSNGKEPSSFLAEVRRSMLERGIIKDIYEPITEDIINKAFTHFKKNPFKNKMTNSSSTRIFDVARNTPQNRTMFSQMMNKLPAVLPVGLGIGAASQLGNQEQNTKLRQGGYVNDKYNLRLLNPETY